MGGVGLRFINRVDRICGTGELFVVMVGFESGVEMIRVRYWMLRVMTMRVMSLQGWDEMSVKENYS